MDSSTDPSSFVIMLLLVGTSIILIGIAGTWRVFIKAGKPGWACIVPLYNVLILLEITGKPQWWLILFLIPGINVIAYIWTINLLSKSFGQDQGFAVGLVLLWPLFMCMLGFGDAVYLGPPASDARLTGVLSST